MPEPKLTLEDAYLRLERAREHFNELKTLCRDVCEAQAKATRIYTDRKIQIVPDQFATGFLVESGNAVIPPRCSVLIGDVASNLRSSLNYLVAALVELDSGTDSELDWIQFPIWRDAEGFRKETDRRLAKRLSPAHLAAIEKLQPYNGGNWARLIQILSNRDKHRKLVLAAHDYRISGTVTTSEDPADGDSTKVAMHMNIEPVLCIEMSNIGPVIETLEELQSHVAQTLNAFKPEFQ